MPIKRKTVNLAVSGNALNATDSSTGLATTDAGVQGEDGAVWFSAAIPEDWRDLTCRLQILAVNGNYDESGLPVDNVISMPVRQGVAVPGNLTVSLIGSTDSGVRRTADCRDLIVSPSGIAQNAVSKYCPQDFETLKTEVDTEVVHRITGSGGALVTKTDSTTYDVNVTGTGGDMLQANYANGSGLSNLNKVDRAVYAESAGTAGTASAAAEAACASGAKPGSALETQITSLQTQPDCGLKDAPPRPVPNTPNTPRTFDTEFFDTDGMFDKSADPSRLCCKTAGYYVIHGYLSFPAGAATGVRDIFIQVNGGTHHGEIEVPPSAGDYTQLSVETILYLNSGDFITLGCYQSSGSGINAENAAIQAVLIRR